MVMFKFIAMNDYGYGHKSWRSHCPSRVLGFFALLQILLMPLNVILTTTHYLRQNLCFIINIIIYCNSMRYSDLEFEPGVSLLFKGVDQLSCLEQQKEKNISEVLQ